MCDIFVDCIDNDRMRKIKGLEERLKTLHNFLRGSHEILQSQVDRAKVSTWHISHRLVICICVIHACSSGQMSNYTARNRISLNYGNLSHTY